MGGHGLNEGALGALALVIFALGIALGLVLGRERPRIAARRPETPEERLWRLSGRTVPMKGGQRVMGANQPRPKPQDRIPSAPPRGSGGVHPVDRLPCARPGWSPQRGPVGGSGEAKARS